MVAALISLICRKDSINTGLQRKQYSDIFLSIAQDGLFNHLKGSYVFVQSKTITCELEVRLCDAHSKAPRNQQTILSICYECQECNQLPTADVLLPRHSIRSPQLPKLFLAQHHTNKSFSLIIMMCLQFNTKDNHCKFMCNSLSTRNPLMI